MKAFVSSGVPPAGSEFELVQFLLALGAENEGVGGGIDLGNDVCRRPGGHGQRKPGGGFEAGEACLLHRGDIGQLPRAGGAGHRQRTQPSGLDMRAGGRRQSAGDVELAADQIGEHLGLRAIWHHRHLRAGLGHERFQGDVRGGADTGYAGAQLSWIGLGVVDQLLERLGLDLGVDDKDMRQPGEDHDRGEFGLRIVWHVAEHELVQCERGRTRHQNGIAVGRGLGGGHRPDIAGGAGAVVDHELLAELVGEILRDAASQQVHRAPGGKRNDQHDRACGPDLRARSLRMCGRGRQWSKRGTD